MKAYKRKRRSLVGFGGVRVAAVLTLAIVAAFLSACGDDNGPTSPGSVIANPPPPPPPRPSRANLSVEVLSFGGVGSGQGNLFFVEFQMTESAGLGANINFFRLEVFRATGELEERREIGADEIVAVTGSNRLEANQSRTESVGFLFRATVKRGRTLHLTVGFTDDQGNNINIVEQFVFV